MVWRPPDSLCLRWEHMFVTSQGRPYGRFRKALAAGNLLLIEAAARELPQIGLADALAILEAFAAADDPRYGTRRCALRRETDQGARTQPGRGSLRFGARGGFAQRSWGR